MRMFNDLVLALSNSASPRLRVILPNFESLF
jgi:hypothetical protein